MKTGILNVLRAGMLCRLYRSLTGGGFPVTNDGHCGMCLCKVFFLVIVIACFLSCTDHEVTEPGMKVFWVKDFSLLSGGCEPEAPREVLKLPSNGPPKYGGDYIFSAIDYCPGRNLLVIACTADYQTGKTSKIIFLDPDRNVVTRETPVAIKRPLKLRVSPDGNDAVIIGITPDETSNDKSCVYDFSISTGTLEPIADGTFTDVSWDASSEVLYLSSWTAHALYEINMRTKSPRVEKICDGMGITGCKEAYKCSYVDTQGNLFSRDQNGATKLLLSKAPILNPRYFSYLRYVYGSGDKLLVAKFKFWSNESFVLDPVKGSTRKVLGDCGAKDCVVWLSGKANKH